jgi:membrane glycosyltransferase
MACVLAAGGWSWPQVGLYAAYLVTLPWLVTGLWNAVIGMVLLARGRTGDDPLALRDAPEMPITTRTAVVMAVRNEEAARAVGRPRHPGLRVQVPHLHRPTARHHPPRDVYRRGGP